MCVFWEVLVCLFVLPCVYVCVSGCSRFFAVVVACLVFVLWDLLFVVVISEFRAISPCFSCLFCVFFFIVCFGTFFFSSFSLLFVSRTNHISFYMLGWVSCFSFFLVIFFMFFC